MRVNKKLRSTGITNEHNSSDNANQTNQAERSNSLCRIKALL